MKIYNTLGGKLEAFKPSRAGKANMYVCGLTPYDSMHIGHARTFVVFDIVRRWLAQSGYKVYFVQNVTDIDDKIIRRAKEKGEDPLALSARFDAESRGEMAALGIMPADAYPKVSGHILEIIALVEQLLDRKAAYVTETGVYFDVPKFKGYGKLSGQDLEQVRAGARVEVDEKKKNPADFALWKTAKLGELSFDSPWGRGRPGWHIECSAMSMKYMRGHGTEGGKRAGAIIDIHGGARDLVFPHHENEIAQSEAASGKKFVGYWMHSGFLTANGEKMAKSLGNFTTVKDVLAKHDANAIRMFFALAHYRSPIDFSWEALGSAKGNVEKLLICASELEKIASAGVGQEAGGSEGRQGEKGKGANMFKERFAACMDNDFDTPGAAAAMFEMAREINGTIGAGKMWAKEAADYLAALNWMLGIFGIEKKSAPSHGRNMEGAAGELAESEIKKIIAKRSEARARGNYAESDRIRTELEGKGIIVEDKKGVTRWRRKEETAYREI